MDKKYEVIIFDADETLFDFEKAEEYAIKNTMVEFHLEYDEAHHLKVYKDINFAIWKEFESGLITQEKLKTERFKRLFSLLKIKFDEVRFAEAYMRNLSYASLLYDNSIELIESLHKNYRLSIITNGLTAVQENRVRKSVIGKYFEDIVISEEVQVAKPNPRIFEIALSNIEYTDKSKVLMVDDSLSSDIKGGINFGIDTCWLNRKGVINNSEIIPTYEILNLTEIKLILA